ncbi:urease accessory protein UreD [Celerinatantimonas sp. YJH-8]|uniref:urease accessory protein UreD n=1 Tax=Celerinatantimonas sp. YJH-8 TaxID=3228714 RepID=UPI0038CA309A
MTVMETPILPPLQWPAQLELKLALTERGNRLIHNRHHGPLYIQKPFYPEQRDCAHLYLLHPPGGIVSGDQLHIDITQQAGGHALVTTPGAARVYKGRCDQSEQGQHVTLTIEDGASIEWLPMETLIYPDSFSRLTQQVHLAEHAQYLGWEVVCLGLPECQQPFTTGRYEQQLAIYRAGRLKFHDRLVVLGSDHPESLMQPNIALAGYPIHGLLIATIAADADLLTQLRELTSREEEDQHVGISCIHDMLIVRYLGHHSELCRQLFTRIWSELRPKMLGRNACPPRIWRT